MISNGAANTTVVLPVWDRYVAGPLQEALGSLRGQDAAARIVVVDNASDVGLPDLPDTTVVRSSSRVTVGAARNLGLAQASTPYVLFWDADDIMLPGTLRFLEGKLRADAGLVAFGAAIIEEPSGKRHRWPRPWIARLVRRPLLLALIDCIWSVYPTTGATLMRTELVRSAGGYGDADSGEDWCLGVSLAFRGPLGWSERPGRAYRLHEQSMWARHMTIRHQFAHARTVRARLRTDPGIPRAIRLALPLIGAAQYAALAAHGVVAVLRTVRGSGRR